MRWDFFQKKKWKVWVMITVRWTRFAWEELKIVKFTLRLHSKQHKTVNNRYRDVHSHPMWLGEITFFFFIILTFNQHFVKCQQTYYVVVVFFLFDSAGSFQVLSILTNMKQLTFTFMLSISAFYNSDTFAWGTHKLTVTSDALAAL